MKSFLIVILLFIFPQNIYSQNISVIQKIRTIPRLQNQLEFLVGMIVKEWKGDHTSIEFSPDPIFRKPLGVFITAKKGDEVRGCVGSLLPHEKDLEQEIRRNLKLAFTQDPRHRPVQKEETSGMEIFVSALGSPKLLSKPYQINPAREAILIRSGSKEALALPGEAKTLRYLLAFLKAKAGIQKSENFQLYRLESESVEVKLE